jgi:hypothetical protein
MKLETPCLPETFITIAGSKSCPNWFSDLLVLVKLRVNVFVVATTFVGFALHASILSNWLLLLHTLIGTGLVAGAAAAANQTLERRFDQDMLRTRNRPLAAGRFQRRTGIFVSGLFLATGCLWLGSALNLQAMLLALLTFLIYAFAYTPLKRFTSVCILAGAVAGASPSQRGRLKVGIWRRTTRSRRLASPFLQDAVTEVNDAGVGCGDSALRQQFADGAVGNTAFAQRSNVLLERQ